MSLSENKYTPANAVELLEKEIKSIVLRLDVMFTTLSDMNKKLSFLYDKSKYEHSSEETRKLVAAAADLRRSRYASLNAAEVEKLLYNDLDHEEQEKIRVDKLQSNFEDFASAQSTKETI